jgi:Mor family transcriptional regulator
MTIEVIDVIENEDGSADIQFEVSDKKVLKHLIEEGMNFVLLKNAYNLNTNEIVKILEKSVDKRTESV